MSGGFAQPGQRSAELNQSTRTALSGWGDLESSRAQSDGQPTQGTVGGVRHRPYCTEAKASFHNEARTFIVKAWTRSPLYVVGAF